VLSADDGGMEPNRHDRHDAARRAIRAAFAHRIRQLSRELEQVARRGRDFLAGDHPGDPNVVRMWQLQRGLFRLAEAIDPRRPAAIPDSM
jgi:hypothetical protein